MCLLTYKIALEGVRMHAFHGMLEQEKTVGNEFEINAWVEYKAPPMLFDSLDEGISYADIFSIIHSEMLRPSLTLEHVALRIRASLLSAFPIIEACSIKITKLAPPIKGMQGSASVEIH